MKNNLNILSVLLLGVIFFSSCASNKLLYTNIDVLRPANVAFPGDVNSLLVVNNTVAQPEDIGHTSQQFNQNPKSIKVNTDSLSLFLLSALFEELDSKGFFAENELLHNSINAGNNFEKLSSLSSLQVQTLAKSKNVDAILSLNKLQTTDAMVEYYNRYNDMYTLALDVVYDTWWTIQYPDETKKTEVLHFQDTVYWESSSQYRRDLFENFPNRIDALVDGALYVGQKMLNRIIPYWDESERYLFEINDALMRQGMDSVYLKNWIGACQIWENALAKNTSKKTKSLILHNLAVAYEITGDLDKALNYSTQAIDLYANTSFPDKKSLDLMLNYRDELLTRRKQSILLREQIAE